MGTNEHLNAEQVARQATYWIDLAEYDMAATRTMLDGGHYLYVGFLCHLVVEKGLKGLYVSVARVQPPRIHALVKLAKLADIYDGMAAEDQALLDILEPLNIEARYPAQKEALLQSLTAARCRALIADTERVLQWIERMCDDALKNMPAS